MSQLVTSLRERKKAQTRAALAAAAADLFARRGYDATTVEDIAAAVEVSPRTFFRYYATKDEVLFGDADEVRRRFREILEGQPAELSLGAAIRNATIELLAADEVDTATARLLMRLVNQHPPLQARYLELLRQIEDDVAAWVAARLGEDAGDLRPRLVGAALMAARRVAFDAWIEEGAEDFTPYLLRALELLDDGLGDLS